MSGALAAARRGYDIVGIAVVALVTACGGGLLRDGLFLQDGPPVLVRTPAYIGLVLGAVVLVALLARRMQGRVFLDLVALADAVGLGAYAVVGAQLAQQRGLTPLGVVLVAVVTAVGGGILRDLVMRQEPEIFRPGTLVALAALTGAGVFLAGTRWLLLDERLAAWLTIAVVATLRAASVYWGLKTRAVLEDEKPS